MSHYTVLALQNSIEICSQYGIHGVKSQSILSGGSENTNYLIVTDDRQFVLTICEQKTAESAGDLVRLLEHLSVNGFNTSRVLRTVDNNPISEWNGKPVMLKVFIEGDIIKDLSANILEAIGTEIGKLHQIDAPNFLPKILNYGIEYFHEVENYAPDSSFKLWLNEIEGYITPFLAKDLPKSLIHSDIFYSNIVVSKDRNTACIMDFEEATNYYRIFDIGMTIIGLCGEGSTVNLKKAHYLLKGYQQQILLTETERNSLQAFTVYAAAAMTFWRHRNFNHINPNPEMFNHYMGLQVLADYVKKLSKDDFLEILN